MLKDDRETGTQIPCLGDRHAGTDRMLEGVRVLVVDDNRELAIVNARLLQLAGFEVRTVFEGFEALRVASEFHPSITLLDINLPDIDGYEVARRLRSDITLQAMTIIAVTAYGHEEARQQAKAIGFNHYLVKPVAFADLRSLLIADLLRAPTDCRAREEA